MKMNKDIFKKPKDLESDLQKRVLNYLKEKFPESYFRKISDKTQSHIPDIIGSMKGRFIGIELKRRGETPRPGQYNELNKITESRGYSNWFDNFEDFKKWITLIGG